MAEFDFNRFAAQVTAHVLLVASPPFALILGWKIVTALHWVLEIPRYDKRGLTTESAGLLGALGSLSAFVLQCIIFFNAHYQYEAGEAPLLQLVVWTNFGLVAIAFLVIGLTIYGVQTWQETKAAMAGEIESLGGSKACPECEARKLEAKKQRAQQNVHFDLGTKPAARRNSIGRSLTGDENDWSSGSF